MSDDSLRLPLLADDSISDGAAPLVSVAEARAPNPLRYTAPFILCAEGAERLAYYGLATNLVSYFSAELGWRKSDAASSVNTWSGACYTTALLGAVVADSALGRYHTIVLFSCVYLAGLVALTISAGLEATGASRRFRCARMSPSHLLLG